MVERCLGQSETTFQPKTRSSPGRESRRPVRKPERKSSTRLHGSPTGRCHWPCRLDRLQPGMALSLRCNDGDSDSDGLIKIQEQMLRTTFHPSASIPAGFYANGFILLLDAERRPNGKEIIASCQYSVTHLAIEQSPGRETR